MKAKRQRNNLNLYLRTQKCKQEKANTRKNHISTMPNRVLFEVLFKSIFSLVGFVLLFILLLLLHAYFYSQHSLYFKPSHQRDRERESTRVWFCVLGPGFTCTIVLHLHIDANTVQTYARLFAPCLCVSLIPAPLQFRHFASISSWLMS